MQPYAVSIILLEIISWVSAVKASPDQENIEPPWVSVDNFNDKNLLRSVSDWLLDEASLTDRLINFYEEVFSVKPLNQSWTLPLESEIALLESSGDEKALIRKVVLCLNKKPVVFARSVIPKIAIEGPLSHLQNLGDKSLGAILFDTPGLFRSSFEIALISGNNPYLPQEFFQTNPVWGRRSCFSISSNKIIVSEIFLNTFEPWTLKKLVRQAN